jgi:hypothetical protein
MIKRVAFYENDPSKDFTERRLKRNQTKREAKKEY